MCDARVYLRPGSVSAPHCPECNPGPVDYYWLDCWYTFFSWAGCSCVAGEAFLSIGSSFDRWGYVTNGLGGGLLCSTCLEDGNRVRWANDIWRMVDDGRGFDGSLWLRVGGRYVVDTINI